MRDYIEKFFDLFLIKDFLEIGSDYVSDGDRRYQSQCAPIKIWFYSLSTPLIISIFLLSFTIYIDYFFNLNAIKNSNPSDFFLGVISSLLGFGIGAYALVFSVSGKILKSINEYYSNSESKTEYKPTILSINSEFAFPLITLTITLIILTIQNIIREIIFIKFLSIFFVFFSITMMYKLIINLYNFGKLVILEKI